MGGGKSGVLRHALHYLLWHETVQSHNGWCGDAGGVVTAEFPNGDHHAGELAGQLFERTARLPPVFRVEVTIMGPRNAYLDLGWEDTQENVAGTAGVIVRGYNDDAAPFVLDGQRRQRLRFFPGVRGVVSDGQDFVFRYAALNQVMLHQFGDE